MGFFFLVPSKDFVIEKERENPYNGRLTDQRPVCWTKERIELAKDATTQAIN